MPITREFIWDTPTDRYHASYGVYGWMPAKQPNFDPLMDGFGFCHDILEHFSATDETIEHEMLAFGSMLYLRGESDYWAATGRSLRNPDPAEQMHGDIQSFVLHDTVQAERSIADPGRTRDLGTEAEDILWRMRSKIVQDDEWNDECNVQLARAYGWIRKGYRKAARRWNLNLNERLALWMNCEEYLDKVTQTVHADMFDRLIISVDKERLTCTHRIIYREDEFDPED